MAKKGGALKKARKELKLNLSELDKFINAKHTSTRYYLEDNLHRNKTFRYLLFLKLNGASIDEFFEDFIKQENIKYKKNEQS